MYILRESGGALCQNLVFHHVRRYDILLSSRLRLDKTDGDYTVVRTDKLNSVLSLYATAMTARISTAPAR